MIYCLRLSLDELNALHDILESTYKTSRMLRFELQADEKTLYLKVRQMKQGKMKVDDDPGEPTKDSDGAEPSCGLPTVAPKRTRKRGSNK